MANPLMMKKKAKKRGTTILIVAIFIALGIATAILAIAAFPSQSFFGSVSILYKAVGINGEVSATWKVGSEVNSMKTPTGETSVHFGYEEIENGSLSPLDENNNEKEIKLDRVNDFVEFTYTFKNYGTNAYTVMLDFTEYTNENIGITYKYNTNAYGPTEYGLVVKAVTASSPKNAQGKQYEESTYNIKLKVQDIALNASFISDFYWTMETYETTGNEELINLTNLTYTENTGDAAGTYSASYNGSALTNNTLYYPSQFGSAEVTTIKPGSTLPANTNVIIAEGIEEVADNAFANQSVASVTFKEAGVVEASSNTLSAKSNTSGLKRIGKNAFRGTGITKVTIPSNIELIDSVAFGGCISLTDVTIEGGNNYVIGAEAFAYGNAIKNLTLGEGIVEIGQAAFVRQPINQLTIPSSLKTIGAQAFYECKSLNSLIIPDSVISIGESALSKCSALTNLTIGKGLTSISANTFYYCSGLSSVTIPDSVTSIGNGAFANCENLNSITIPDSVISIGASAFSWCYTLTEITIPNSVTNIRYSTFSSCTGLTRITIPNSVTSIGSGAFSNCTSLTSIEIPNSVTSIEEGAFNECTGLTSIEIPNSVTNIGGSVFYNCTGLTSVAIGSGVTSIGNYAFSGCTGLTEINYNATITNTLISSSNIFLNVGTNVKECVVNIGDNVRNIPAYLLNGSVGITKVNIPNSVTSIGNFAFSGCTGLTSIEIPNSVTSIGNYAFQACAQLTELTIPSSVTKIGTRAFDGCTNVEVLNFNADLSSNPTTVSTYAFYQLGENVESCVVYVGDNVTKLTDYLFLDAHGITYAYIPSTTTFGSYPFANCRRLTETSWNGNSFAVGGNYAGWVFYTVNKTRAEFDDALINPAAKVGDRTYLFIENVVKAMNGEITLLKDFTITSTVAINGNTTIKAGKDITITCSADNTFYVYNSLTLGEVGGPTITLKANGITGRIININRGGVILNSAIIDGNGTAQGIIAGNEAEYNADPTNIVCGVQMNGGEIKNCVGNGAAIAAYFNTNFEMNGGKIHSNTSTSSSYGGEVIGPVLLSRGAGNIIGGEISNNTISATGSSSFAYGGGLHVCDGATLTMNGGTIKNNKASATYSFGGNVYVAKNTTFTFYAGSIEGDGSQMARLGGGVANIGTFNMSGGEIKNCGAEIGGGVMNLGTATITSGTISGCAATNNASNVSKAIANNGTLNLGNVSLGSGQDIAMGYQKVSLASSVFPESYGVLNVIANLTSQYTITFIQVTGTFSANVEAGSKVISNFTSGTVFATYIQGATADAGDFTTSGYTFYVSSGNVYMQ